METIIGYNPYLKVMGGGEAYFLRALTSFRNSAKVYIEMNDYSLQSQNRIIELANLYHDIDLSGITFTDIDEIRRPDVYLSMHNSDFVCCQKAKYNINIVQVPQMFNMGLEHPHIIVFNSDFTRRHWQIINNNPRIDYRVITPPVLRNPVNHKNEHGLSIISIGRFAEQLHNKGEKILISAFRKLKNMFPINRKPCFHLVGNSSMLGERSNYFQELQCDGVFIHSDLSRYDLWNLLAEADVFWNSTGYGYQENMTPHKVEHYGISIAEALISGLIPVIQPKGGLVSQLEPWVNFVPWETEEELIINTYKLLNDHQLRFKMINWIKRARWTELFNDEITFAYNWSNILKDLFRDMK